jgi:ubiquitin-conjugating enzyme E2 R
LHPHSSFIRLTLAMAATKLLSSTLKKILSDPVEGFTVEVEDESNLFEWKIYIEGPKDTPYEGGIFQLNMKFPSEFPMSPPELRFISDFWHPNVYKDSGMVCISILHPPGEDEFSGELASERWLPTQTVTTIILSVISLLNAPNFSSPANVDASIEWRNEPECFRMRCARLIQKANREKPSHIIIPHPDTNPEEKEKYLRKMKEVSGLLDENDLMLGYSDEDSSGSGTSRLASDDESEEHENERKSNLKPDSKIKTQRKNIHSKHSKQKSSTSMNGAHGEEKEHSSSSSSSSSNAKFPTTTKNTKSKHKQRISSKKEFDDSSATDGSSEHRPSSAAQKRRKSRKCTVM